MISTLTWTSLTWERSMMCRSTTSKSFGLIGTWGNLRANKLKFGPLVFAPASPRHVARGRHPADHPYILMHVLPAELRVHSSGTSWSCWRLPRAVVGGVCSIARHHVSGQRVDGGVLTSNRCAAVSDDLHPRRGCQESISGRFRGNSGGRSCVVKLSSKSQSDGRVNLRRSAW